MTGMLAMNDAGAATHIVYIGGPCDGEEMMVRGRPTMIARSCFGEDNALLGHPDLDDRVSVRSVLYSLEFGPFGLPSIDDYGRTRYRVSS